MSHHGHPSIASTSCKRPSGVGVKNCTMQHSQNHTEGDRDIYRIIEGSLEVKLPTIWADEKQSRAEAERRERLEERRVEEKE